LAERGSFEANPVLAEIAGLVPNARPELHALVESVIPNPQAVVDNCNPGQCVALVEESNQDDGCPSVQRVVDQVSQSLFKFVSDTPDGLPDAFGIWLVPTNSYDSRQLDS